MPIAMTGWQSCVRRSAVLSAAGLALAGLTGCGQAGTPSERSPSVGLVVASQQLNVSQEMAAGFRYGVSRVPGARATVLGPDIVDGPAEIRMFQGLRGSAPGGVAVFTLSPDLFAQPLAAAVRGGLPVIAVDNPVARSSDVTLFIGNDSFELGQQIADELVSHLTPKPRHGTIVLGTSTPGAPVLEDRARGMRAELAKLLPGVRVVGPYDTKQEAGANLAAWRLLVEANPHALAFMGTGDADSYHLAAIRRSTGGRWIAAGFDLDPRSLRAVARGDLLLMSPEHYVKGALAGTLQARAAVDGTPLPRGWIYTPGLVITKGNIREVLARQESASSRRAYFKATVDFLLAHLPQNTRPMSAIR